jgi:two-component system, NarL family, response regulator LiaR
MNPIRVIVVDDHPVVRKGIISMLETEPDIQIVGECKDGDEAIRKTIELRPDVVLMDLVMPVKDGIETIREMKQLNLSARILVLTSFTSDEKIFSSLEAGAIGYLLKDSDPEDLIRAIRLVHRGESSLHPMIARRLLQELTHSDEKKTLEHEHEVLTDRELEVLKYIAQGLNNQEIAKKMFVSPSTVHSHVSRVLSKLHVSSRTQAALIAIHEGIVPPPLDSSQ